MKDRIAWETGRRLRGGGKKGEKGGRKKKGGVKKGNKSRSICPGKRRMSKKGLREK